MDFVTHAVAGLTVGRVAAPNTRAALLTGALAGLAPDVDILVWASSGFDAYLEARGGITHGALALAIGPIALAVAVAAAARSPLRPLWIVAVLAWASHLGLDALTARGIAPLAPFTDLRVALGWVYPLDLTLLGLLTLPLWVPRVVQVAPRRVAALAASLVVGWIVTCGALHALAVTRFEETLIEAGVEPKEVLVVPAAFLPLWWSGVAWDGEAWHPAAVRPGRPAVLGERRLPNDEHPAVRAALASPHGARFLRIAAAPVAEVRCRPDGYVVLLRDLLSADPWSGAPAPPRVFVVGVKQGQLSVRDQYWATWLTGRQVPVPECGSDDGQNPAISGH